MATSTSAGLLLYRMTAAGGVEVLIGHMGGPFWARKTEGAWSIPKGELEQGEGALTAALREFEEELGLPRPSSLVGDYVPLGSVRQKSGKTVHAWAVESDLDPATAVFGTFEMEWPPRSGRTAEFPELDEVRWVSPDEARRLLVAAQREFLDRLEQMVVVGAVTAAVHSETAH